MTDDFGDIVHGIFLEPEKWDDKLVQGVSDIKSFDEVSASFQRGMFQAIQWMITTDPPSHRDESSLRGSTKVAGLRGVWHPCASNRQIHVRLLQASGGRYFSDKTEANTALELKRNASKAYGKVADGIGLTSLEPFFVEKLH